MENDLDLIRQMQILLREKFISIIHSLENCAQGPNIQANTDICFEMMSQLYEILLCKRSSSADLDVDLEIKKMDKVVDYFKEGLHYFQDEVRKQNFSNNLPPIFHTGKKGRPGYHISEELLENLIECDFGPSAIAKLLSVHVSIIHRHLAKYSLAGVKYSDISDTDLIDLIRTLKIHYPDAGYRTIGSLLREKGHRVQRKRVQDCLRAADPEGVLFRRLYLNVRRVTRRTYNVRAPRALWHIDGNHKLIRWRFVIHGGIDGYSRLPVFLQVNTNNRASSVLEAFLCAVNEWGMPEKVRSDKGGENIKVAQFMLENKGCGSFISGRSVHNQRIERLWREIWIGCLSVYYQLFYYMEDENILNVDDEIHITALHLVFQRRIQCHLNQFRDALIRRPLRTSNNKTPLQLWIEGQMNDPIVNLNPEELNVFGIDYDGPVATEYDFVEVPETQMPSDNILSEIKVILENESSNFGIDNFLLIVRALNNK